MKDKIIKGTTLLLFVSLVAGFIAYRSGRTFSIQVGPDRSVPNNQSDTIPKADSLKRLEIIPSSKALILREHWLQLNDSVKQVESDSSLNSTPMIHSSKSGIILKPEDFKKMGSDTIRKDSIKQE